MRRRVVLAALLALAACVPQGTVIAPPAVTAVTVPALQLDRVGFTDLPGWRDAALDKTLVAFIRACTVLTQRPDATPVGGYGGTVADWRVACAAPKTDPRTFFEQNFTPYALAGTGLFTGYYEPQMHASRTRQGIFQAPVYGLPPDLVRADLSLFDPKWRGEHISGRLEGHALKPYDDRATIEARGAHGAPVLLYADPVDLFFLQIQGSGRVTLTDGSTVRLAYAGENGRPYTAIGRTLIAQGALTRENVSLQSIRAWLVAHPAQAKAVMDSDQSYVFFKQAPLDDPALGATGTLGVPLAPLANMAVDQRLHPLGAPFWVAADGADPVRALLVAADTGGAIRGAVRGDIFFGWGAEAEARAGAMKGEGRLFVLLPDALSARLGDHGP